MNIILGGMQNVSQGKDHHPLICSIRKPKPILGCRAAEEENEEEYVL
jgi:hypothetical protein